MDLTPYTPGWFLEILLRPLTRLLELMGIPGIFSGLIVVAVFIGFGVKWHRKKTGGFTIHFYIAILAFIFMVWAAIMAIETGQYEMP